MEKTQTVLNDRVSLLVDKNADESWTDKALREVHLVGQGATGIVDAAKASVSKEHRLETAGELALSVGVGLGAAYLTRGRGFGYLAGRTLATVGTLSLAKDSIQHGAEALDAMGDAWRSDRNMQHDSAVMKKSVGQFAFDTGLMSIGGLAGAKAGHKLFKPEIPELYNFQMSDKTGIRQDYYNQFYGAEWKANQSLNVGGKLTPERVADAKTKLPDLLRKVRTYSEYLDDVGGQVKTANPDHPKLDMKGIKNALLYDRPSAVQLDQIATRVRSFGDQDLSNPKVMEALLDNFQAGRHIIYGNDVMQARRMILGKAMTPDELTDLVTKNRSIYGNLRGWKAPFTDQSPQGLT